MNKKLLVLSRTESIGGHEYMLRRILATAIRLDIVDLVVFCHSSSPLVNPGYKSINISRGRFVFFDVIRDFIRIKKIQKKSEGSRLLLSVGYLGEWFQIFCAGLIFRKDLIIYCPIVSRFEDIGAKFGFFQSLIFKLIAKSISGQWVFLAYEQEILFRQLFDSSARTRSIPNLIEPAFIQKNIESSFDECKSPLRILIVGRLDINQKGFDFVLDHLSNFSEPVDLTIIGRGSGELVIAEKIKSTKVAIKLLPWQDLSDTLKDYDILLIPSRFEGVPLVMLEAMFVGLPIVASDIPGHRAYLSEDMLFPVGNMARAFSIIARLASSRERNEVAMRNRSAYFQKCQASVFEKAIIDILGEGDYEK